MKKNKFWLAIVLLPLLLLTGSSFKTDNGVNIIYYYSDNQGETLLEIITNEIENDKTPVLYFTATWCGPCKGFNKSLKDEKVQESLNGATIIKIDVDKDKKSEQHARTYDIRAVPTFIKVDNEGKVLDQMTSAKWGGLKPKIVARAMNKFLKK